LRACKELLTGNKELQKWDVAYFSEKIRQSKYQFDEESFRPFFEIQNVIDSVFEHARLLYGLVFKKRIDIPVYHEDVTVYEVTDANKKYVGILYFDLFPRASKAGGAWIDTFRNQHKKDEKNIRSNALIVGNLTKPTKDSPSLLSFWDVETIFHEFGHGLHILLSESRYVSPGALQSRWDFIELPSQFMQTFLTQKRSLEIVGKHYQTGEVITPELIEKKIAADKFLAAWIMIGQIGDATLDMKWHDGSAEGVIDIQSFEKEIKKPFSFFPDMPNTNQSTTFSHIFDGGYSAAYYSYHWAEVLSADAFEYFKENGLFSKEIAEKFRENILSKGNSEEPMELYKRFRGREPDPHALLRMKGLE
jgi:peptidyl-dipeptidase Dcp